MRTPTRTRLISFITVAAFIGATLGSGGAPVYANTTAATPAPNQQVTLQCSGITIKGEDPRVVEVLNFNARVRGAQARDCSVVDAGMKLACESERATYEAYFNDSAAYGHRVNQMLQRALTDAEKQQICAKTEPPKPVKKELYHQKCHPAQVAQQIAEQVGDKKKPKTLKCECADGYYELGLGEFVICMPEMPEVAQGPRGEKGDTGERGPQGEKGADGTNGTNGGNGVDAQLNAANLTTLIQQLIDEGKLRLPQGGTSLPPGLSLDKLISMVNAWDQLLLDVAKAKSDAALAVASSSKNAVAIEQIEKNGVKLNERDRTWVNNAVAETHQATFRAQKAAEEAQKAAELAKKNASGGARQFHFGIGGFVSWKPPIDKAPGDLAYGSQLSLDWYLMEAVAIGVNVRGGGVKIGGPVDQSALYIDAALGVKYRVSVVQFSVALKVDDNVVFGGSVVNSKPVDSLGYNAGGRFGFGFNLLKNHLHLGLEAELLYGHTATVEALMPQPGALFPGPKSKVTELNGVRYALGLGIEFYY